MDAKGFNDVWQSRRTVELCAGLGVESGDVFQIRELGPEGTAGTGHTGRSVLVLVVHVLRDAPCLPTGFVALSLKLLTRLTGELPCGM
jgi:hypothetical protein